MLARHFELDNRPGADDESEDEIDSDAFGDPLAAARGIVFGVLLGSASLVAVGGIVWWLVG